MSQHLAQRLQEFKSKTKPPPSSSAAIEGIVIKAAVQAVGSSANDGAVAALVSGGGSNNFFGLSYHGYVHEPFSGAWQRNISESCHPSIAAFSAVYACISIISGDISTLPIKFYKTGKKGRKELPNTHSLVQLMLRPNEYQTRMDLVQQALVSVLFTGNAFIYKHRANGPNTPITELVVLDPRKVKVLVADSGDIFYEVSKHRLQLPGQEEERRAIPASEIIHHRLMCFEHPLCGVSPLYAAGSSAAVGASIIMQSSSFFRNQSRPSGILTSDNKIDPKEAATLKERWDSLFVGGNVGRTAVLGDGLKWEQLGMTAQDAQLIDQLKYAVNDVAMAFRVPSFLLGDLSKATYKNSEQQNRAYLSGCLRYHIESLEARLTLGLELPKNIVVEFDLEAFLRTEMDVRFTAWKIAIQSGFKTINEVRAKEDDPPVQGGDEPLIQSQYVPLSMLGHLNVPFVPAPDDTADPDEEDDEEDETDTGDADTDVADDEDRANPPMQFPARVGASFELLDRARAAAAQQASMQRRLAKRAREADVLRITSQLMARVAAYRPPETVEE